MSKVDPSLTLLLFQEGVDENKIPFQPTDYDPALFVVQDEVNGRLRFTYVRFEKSRITVLVSFVLVDQVEKRPCLQVGYAVTKDYRGRGFAKKALLSSMKELQMGFSRAGVTPIYIEAIVDKSNIASQHIAASCISNTPREIVDGSTKKPSLQYLKKLDSI